MSFIYLQLILDLVRMLSLTGCFIAPAWEPWLSFWLLRGCLSLRLYMSDSQPYNTLFVCYAENFVYLANCISQRTFLCFVFFCFPSTAWWLFIFCWISFQKWLLQQTKSTLYLPTTVFNYQRSQDTWAQMDLCYISFLYVMVVSTRFCLELSLKQRHGCGMIWGMLSAIAKNGLGNLKWFSAESTNICTTELQSQGKCW